MVTRMLILCTYFGISLQGAGAKPQWMDNLAELYGRSSCKKRSHKAAWPLFQESLGESGVSYCTVLSSAASMNCIGYHRVIVGCCFPPSVPMVELALFVHD